MKTLTALMSLSLLLVVSCGKKVGSSSSFQSLEKSTPQTESGSTNEGNSTPKILSFTAERPFTSKSNYSELSRFEKEINTHILKFKISTRHIKSSRIECNKLIFDRRSNFMEAAFDSNGEAAMVTKFQGTDPNEVEYECHLLFNREIIESRNFVLRKSFVVAAYKSITDLGLSPKDKIGILLLRQDAILAFRNLDIDLEVEELISFNGTVTSYPVNDATSIYSNSVGLSAGNMKLKIKKGSGDLNIEMRGMDAGPKTTMPAEKTNQLPADPIHNSVCGNPRKGGPNYSDKNCFGQKGHPGEKGLTGAKGLPGGDSGLLELIIEEIGDLKVNVELEAGKGGLGEKGGKGGPGSQGGNGATVRWTTYSGCSREGPCNDHQHSYKYPNGSNGDKGPDGDPGENGENGKIIPAKITIGDDTQMIDSSWKF